MHLKTDCREFADEDTLKGIINKYSNFVNSPIQLNGKKINVVQPIWLKEAKSIDAQQHYEFYRYVSGSYDRPRFTLHYTTDVPLSIHALLYFPEGKPGLFEMSRDTEPGVALYSRRVLIKHRTDNLLPKWLRFVKGVVASDDLPLNLSRELLQNSPLLRKMAAVLTGRSLRFLQEQAKRAPLEYLKFYTDYGVFLKEGIITGQDQSEKEELGKLLRFECSTVPAGTQLGLDEYLALPVGDGWDGGSSVGRNIYYMAAPSRSLADNSPYHEGLRRRGQPVLFCYEPYDELVLMQLQRYKGHPLVSAEKEMREDGGSREEAAVGEGGGETMSLEDMRAVAEWARGVLRGRADQVAWTGRLERHPCAVTVEEMGAARHYLRTQAQHAHTSGPAAADEDEELKRCALLRPRLELNPRHPLVVHMARLMRQDPPLAELLVRHLFSGAMLQAGLTPDPRPLLPDMLHLLNQLLDKSNV